MCDFGRILPSEIWLRVVYQIFVKFSGKFSVSLFTVISTPRIKAVNSSETFVNFYQTRAQSCSFQNLLHFLALPCTLLTAITKFARSPTETIKSAMRRSQFQFLVLWWLYVPPAWTVKNSAFFPHRVIYVSYDDHNKQRLFSQRV
jgi:hypothetical protein